MYEKNKESLIIPNELHLEIFADKNLDIQSITVISMVCKLWYKLSLDNTVWSPLFIKQFNYSPTLCNYSLFKEGFQKQLSLTQLMKKNCELKHECIGKPGLLEAIREKNIPLIYALFNSGHRIIDNFPEGQQEFTKEMLCFLSGCAELPRTLFAKIFEHSFCNVDMEDSDFLALHFIVAEADEKLLHKIFNALGDNLIPASRYRNFDDENFFSFLSHFPIERFALVMRLLYTTLGKSKLSKLLTYQNPDKSRTDWSCIHSASNWVGDYFAITFQYLQKEDYPVLLEKGRDDADIPLFNIVSSGDNQSLSHAINILEDEALTFFRYKDNQGKNILFYALLSEDDLKIKQIEKVMGMDFVNLLLMKDIHGRDILSQVIFLKTPAVLRQVNTVLKLLIDYDCFEVAQELYDSDELTKRISSYTNQNQIIGLFNRYIEDHTNSFCMIL